ncbi:hypothetical protein AB3S75_033033 [Citrus x aurantiifolia]
MLCNMLSVGEIGMESEAASRNRLSSLLLRLKLGNFLTPFYKLYFSFRLCFTKLKWPLVFGENDSSIPVN